MKIIITEDYESLSERAFGIIADTVKNNPEAVLGLATGTTPLGLYKKMTDDHRLRGTSYKHIRTVNLDEYKGLAPTHPQSYAYFMRKNLFCGLDIDLRNTYIENGLAEDEEAECERYNCILRKYRRDIQILGIGSNGHIAFNEPGSPFGCATRLVRLSDSTVKDNARLFKSADEVPRYAYTMGLKDIMKAERVLLLASGKNKAKAVSAAVNGRIDEQVPASILQTHKDCTLICDRQAGELLV